MQIPSTSSAIFSPNEAISYGRMNMQEAVFRAQETARISHSNGGDSVLLLLSDTVEYRETTYTAEGLMSQNPQTSVSQLGDPGAAVFKQLESIHNQYLELIKHRVEYLLRELNDSLKGHSHPAAFQRQGDPAGDVEYFSGQYNFRSVTVTRNISIYASITSPDYFSPEKTAERIVNFALSFYDGGDRAEFAEMVKEAVLKGYEEARAALGGFLPPEADETIELAMKALDDFAYGETVDFSA